MKADEREAGTGPADVPASQPENGATSPVRPCDEWLVWQLADSAFPTGGFVHSSGLEAARQHEEVRDRDGLMLFVEANLEQLGRAALPFVAAGFDTPGRVAEWDALCDAFLTNHVANRASRTQGRAFLSAVERLSGGKTEPRGPEIPFAHFAPVFGACLRRLGLRRDTAMRLFVFNQLRGIWAAAVRLNIIGPMEAQLLQHRTAAKAEKIVRQSKALSLDDIAQTAPLLDIWQAAQDRLYSRLYQS